MPVTTPPVIYDLTTPARESTFGVDGNFIGPFEYSTPNRQYIVLRSSVFGNSQIRVYKSLNQGQSWAIMDQANGPADSTAYTVCEHNGVLTVVWQPNAGGGLHFNTFDTNASADIWGVEVSGGSTPTLAIYKTGVNSSTGDIAVIVTALTGGGFAYLRYSIISGGAWGATTDFTTGAANKDDSLKQILVDTNQLVHVFYQTTTAGSVFNHRTLTFAGVVAAVNQIDVGTSGVIGRATLLGSKMILPTKSGSQPAIYLSNNNSSSPTWSARTQITTSVDFFSEGFSLTSLDGLTAYFFWIVLDYTDPLNVIDRLYYSSTLDGVVWQAPTLMYDAVTNPQLEDPTVLPTDQDLHTLSVTQLLNGTFGIYTAMEENGFCAGYALLDGACDILFTPPELAGVVEMPPARQAVYAEPVIAYETGGESFEYTITTPPPPPTVTHVDGGMINVGISQPGLASTTYTQTGVVTSTTGVDIVGQPVYPTYQTPVSVQVVGHVRLVA